MDIRRLEQNYSRWALNVFFWVSVSRGLLPIYIKPPNPSVPINHNHTPTSSRLLRTRKEKTDWTNLQKPFVKHESTAIHSYSNIPQWGCEMIQITWQTSHGHSFLSFNSYPCLVHPPTGWFFVIVIWISIAIISYHITKRNIAMC